MRAYTKRAGFRTGGAPVLPARRRLVRWLRRTSNCPTCWRLHRKFLGKMLSYSAIEKLYGLYDWLGMPPDLIVRLLEYCVELGKKDMRYIEKVAVSWREMGIGTVAEAERYIERQNYKRTYVYQIQKSSESRTASSRRASCAILASGIRSAYRWSWRLLLMITV